LHHFCGEGIIDKNKYDRGKVMSTQSRPTASIYDLLQQSAERFGEQTAFTYLKTITPEFSAETHSYASVLNNVRRVVRLIHDLADSNSTTPPVVSFLLPNTPETHYLLWGAETAGIANPLNPLLSTEALLALMTKAKTDILIALGPNPASDIWEKAQAVAAQLPGETVLIPAIFADQQGAELFETQLQNYSDEPLATENLPKGDDVAAYFHTGGTTSMPKLAMHTHTNQLCSAYAFQRTMKAGINDVGINGLPMFHVAGALVTGLGGLAVGINTVLPTMGGFRNPEVIQSYWDIVEYYGVTIAGAIPTSIAAIAEVPIGSADISALRYLWTGGATLPRSVEDDITQLTGCPIYQIYGMTEAAGCITMPNLELAPLPGSAGHVSGDVDMRIDTSDQRPNAVGEICVRGPLVFPGYLGVDTSPLDKGWLRTGDLGYLDESNNLFITGRAKDLIIRSGNNIDPIVIETCLESHPAVSMAAAVGRPDTYAGELPVAYVQLHPGHPVSETELRDYAMAHIDERPACPKSVTILDALPLTAVGKLHKPTLRAMATEVCVRDALGAIEDTAEADIQAKVLPSGGLQVTIKSPNSNESLAAACDDLGKQLHVDIVLEK